MTENPEPEELVPVGELTPEEANRIIHSHRKVRYGKAVFITIFPISQPRLLPDARCGVRPCGC